jgi:hypothetical protein
MNPIIQKYLDSIELGNMQVFKNIAIVPLMTSLKPSIEYLTLSEALEQKLLTITELDKSGSVPELKVSNTAVHYVLLLDGEELMGAKQNRVLNTTILLKPQSETIIPVSCTERGRWSYKSPVFGESGHMMKASSKYKKMLSVHDSLMAKKLYLSDQQQVWDEIEQLSNKVGVHSSTGAMRDIYESKSSNLAECEKAFESIPQEQGLLVIINGEVVGLDILSQVSAYQKLRSKLLRSYIMDALFQPNEENVNVSLDKALSFLAAIKTCSGQHYPSVGYGDDHRFDNKEIAGSALVANEQVIHSAFFSSKDHIPS